VIIPAKNEKDLIEIPQDLREQINFIRVNHLDEVRTLVIIEGGGEGDGQKRKTT
jgi:ATP-dependent Lon protease